MKRLYFIIAISALTMSNAFADAPAVNIDRKAHPNLYDAQKLILEAYNKISVAQKDHRYDLKGNASKAKELLEQASKEIKTAATVANETKKK